MFDLLNNTIVVYSKWLYTDSGVMTKSQYDYYRNAGVLESAQRACKERPGLVTWKSVPEKFKIAIVEKFGDPKKKLKKDGFSDHLELDHKAVDYYRNYRLQDGSSLPEPRKEEYVANASILNACGSIVSNMQSQRRILGGKKTGMWKNLSKIIQGLDKTDWPHSLPRNERRLKSKYNKYQKEGYEGLIHGGYCNKNSEKLIDAAKIWVLTRWADQVDKCANIEQLYSEYTQEADKQGWPLIKEPKTLHSYLNESEVKALWWGHRYGDLEVKSKYSFRHSTDLPSMRDSLWYSDGTKLNYFYQKDGKICTANVYEVMDTYSEVLLGYNISEGHENFQMQFKSFKMALQISGQKPHELKFDGQGGHKKLEAGNFFKGLSKIATKTEPYNGSSKTIENAFYRLQSQFLKRDWFFTGQNIDTKSRESKINEEFVLANKKNLPTYKELKKIYEQRRKEWNEAPHPKTGKPRIEMYRTSENPKAVPVGIWDMVDLFWITRPKSVKCSSSGVVFEHNKEKLEFMVYLEDGSPDLEWLSSNIDRSFHIKYDPEDLSIIHLYVEDPLGLRYHSSAETKKRVHRATQEQEEWENKHFVQVREANKDLRIKLRDKMEEALDKAGRSAGQRGMKSPKLAGIETGKRKKKNQVQNDIGQLTKKKSNEVRNPDQPRKSVYSKM